MILELHIIQNFAPSNLNRDDTNAPKDAEFGGYRRARISSQAIKRAIRSQFRAGLLPAEELAMRTKRLAQALTEELIAAGKQEEPARVVATMALNALKAKVGDDGKTEYLLFVGTKEVAGLAGVCLRHWDHLTAAAESVAGAPGEKRSRREEKKAAKEAVPAEVHNELLACLDGGQATDLALFGRMIADLPEHNIDAASQVAHAISTNQVSMEFDFYTAVDDLKLDDTTGADMMGTVQFNSACFYRYANVDLNQLRANLGGDAERTQRAAEAFVRAAVAAIPTGKQNSMAAQNPPSLVLAVLRDQGMWSLANAFVTPVRPNANGDLVENSVAALDRYWGKLSRMYGTGPIRATTVVSLEDVDLQALKDARVDSLDDLIERVGATLRSAEKEAAAS